MIHMGIVVRDIRMSLNWTVARLARKSGVGVKSIYEIEKHGSGRMDTYEALLGAMGYEIEVVKKDGWDLCG